MALISENWALIIFIIIIVLSILIALYMENYDNYDKTWFHSFIGILTGLGIIIIFLFYYNVVLLQGQQQQLATVQELARINDSVLNSVLDSIRQSSDIIPNFVLSITPLTNTVCCSTGLTGPTGCSISVVPDPINPQTCTEKMTLSFCILALLQDVIISNKITNYDLIDYISDFLQRANSQQ